jgi:diguanylate cyclase (GGDEF)-like protein
MLERLLGEAAGRLGSAGGEDLPGILVEGLGALLDAPVWFARVDGDRLLWAQAYGDEGLAVGQDAGADGTAWGRAWRSRQLVNVVRLSGDEPDDDEPGSVLALPLVVERTDPGEDRPAGRHRGSAGHVAGVVVLTARRAGWFSEADIDAARQLVLAAGRRLAQVAGASVADPGPTADGVTEPAAPDPLPTARTARPDDGEQTSAATGPAGALPRRPTPPSPRPASDVIDLAAYKQAAEPAPDGGFTGWFTPVCAPQPGRLVLPHPRRTPASARAFLPRRTPVRDPRDVPADALDPRLRDLPPTMPSADSMGLWQWDAVTGRCTWSPPVPRLLGLPADTRLTLDHLRGLLAGLERERFELGVRAVHGGHGVAGALRLTTPGGLVKQAYVWSEVRRGPAEEFLGAWGGVVDVTAFEQDAAALRHGLAGLRAAQELTGLATWQWHPGPADGSAASRAIDGVDGAGANGDANPRTARGELVWSEEMYRLAGVTPGDFTPTLEHWYALIHPDDVPRARRLDLEAGRAEGAPAGRERVETFRLIDTSGGIRHVQSWSAAHPGGAVTAAPGPGPVVYGATIDVTRQVHDRMMLERLLATDPVTGLGNRVAYERRIRELLERVHLGPQDAVTLFLLDLDRFKVVNDSLGHQVGDRLLVEVARRLVAVVPEGSVTARMGGDEFVVVPPPGLTEDDARKLAIGVAEALRAPYKLPDSGELLVCPASLGVARAGRRSVSGHDLLREADIALYQAKDSGRDRYVIFDDALRARTQVRESAEQRLRQALECGALAVEYQPVVDFADGRVVGAESLVRLRDPDGSDRLIPPHLFLDIAEQTGLVAELDTWMVETAIRQLAAWARNRARTGEPPWLSVNLSARSIEHPAVVRRLVDAVKRGEVPRDRIRVELKEHSFIGALPAAEVALRQLLANGIGVGIDDFGTGYSALAYLAHFDLDFMKIDRSFVASVGRDERGDAVVLAIVDLAHAHGMKVVAEGVESGRQARRLREMGCDFAQGFHFGRPGPATRIVRN